MSGLKNGPGQKYSEARPVLSFDDPAPNSDLWSGLARSSVVSIHGLKRPNAYAALSILSVLFLDMETLPLFEE